MSSPLYLHFNYERGTLYGNSLQLLTINVNAIIASVWLFIPDLDRCVFSSSSHLYGHVLIFDQPIWQFLLANLSVFLSRGVTEVLRISKLRFHFSFFMQEFLDKNDFRVDVNLGKNNRLFVGFSNWASARWSRDFGDHATAARRRVGLHIAGTTFLASKSSNSYGNSFWRNSKYF